MKKIISLILVLVMIMAFSACGKVEITMQEIYDANKTETLLKNHQSIYVRDEVDGELYAEKYLTKDYVYDYVREEEFDWVEFTTDNANYYCFDGEFVRVWHITPDGATSDFANYRAEHYASAILGTDTIKETIKSVTKKDGRITLKSFLGEEGLADMAELGVASGKFEYALDAKTHEVISAINDYSFDDGTVFYVVSEVSYDTEAVERVKEFLEYDNETENLRNITIVSHPGTEKEVSQSFQAAKGLLVGFTYVEEEYVFEAYADAACTEIYNPYVDTESDQTVYIKWTQAN